MKQPLVFFDLETGGLAPSHPDIQVAAIVVQNWREVEIYEAKIEFDVSTADAEVLAMNSYDHEAWAKHAIPEAQVVKELGEFFRRHASVQMISARGKAYMLARLAGHNALGFDSPRLSAMFKRHNAFLPADAYRPLDTLQLAWWRAWLTNKPPPSFKLAELCAFHDVKLPQSEAHDALSDVRATIWLARTLVGPWLP
jgi:DNA polymerase III epsilon subunit-like protein